jgi:hypothetical protein
MRNQLDFSSQLGGNSNKSTNDNLLSGGFIPVRVVEVNIIPEKNNKSLFQVAGPGDDSKKYNNLGCIKFQMLNQTTPTSDLPSGNIAFPINQNVRSLPLINEIVLVIAGPSSRKYTKGDSNSLKYYYTNSIPVWNSTSVNALPSLQSGASGNTNINSKEDIQAGIPNNSDNPKPEIKLGNTFEDKGNIQNLYPQEGDMLIEGRFGNSLRFGSTGKIDGDFSEFNVNPQNPWSQNGNIGDPITILRNGQKRSSVDFDQWEPIFEDVNDDDSSIYLTSKQNIPLQIAYSTLTSYGLDVTPPEDTTREFQKEGEDFGDEFTSNRDSDSILEVRDSVNVEPDLNTDPNRVQPLFPGVGDNLIQPQSVGDVPSFEFNTSEDPDEAQKREEDPNQRPLSFRERRQKLSRRGDENNRRKSDVPTAAERKRNFRRRNQPTGSAVTESFSQRKRRIRGGG